MQQYTVSFQYQPAAYILVEILEDGACNSCTISITRSTLIMRDHRMPMRRIWVAVHPAYHGMNQFTGLNSNDGQLRRVSLATGLHTPYIQKYQPWRSQGPRTRSLSDQLVTDLHQLQHTSYYSNGNRQSVQFNGSSIIYARFHTIKTRCWNHILLALLTHNRQSVL